MALTPEQKAANKLETQAKNAAFRKRRKAYDDALAQELAKFEQDNAPLKVELDRADQALTAALNARDQERLAILEQIQALQRTLDTLQEKHNINSLANARREAMTAYQSRRNAVTKAVDQAFPDVADTFYRTEWEAKCKALGLKAE